MIKGTESAALWKLLWDYDPNGLLVVDKDMRITLVNPALCSMFHTQPDTINRDAGAHLAQ